MRSMPRIPLWSDAFWRAVNPETPVAGFHRATPGWLSPVRNSVLTDFDIWYVAAGAGDVMIDEHWHAFAAGDLLALKPGSTYQRDRTGEADPFQVYFAHILPFGPDAHDLSSKLAQAWPLKLSLLHRPEFVGLFERLFQAFATRPPRYSLTVKGLTLQVLEVVFEELQSLSTGKRPHAHLGLLRAKAFIETNYTGDVRLEDIAAACDLSPSHLSALFARHLGVSPIEYLLQVRVREAKMLLARGVRVKEAALKVGCHSQHYFCRLFRKRTGLSPTQFSRRHARL